MRCPYYTYRKDRFICQVGECGVHELYETMMWSIFAKFTTLRFSQDYSMKRPCYQSVELGNGAVTYCVREHGHDGEHQPERPICYHCKLLAQWWKDHDARNNQNFYRPAL
jgi:hypothetical protein